jgi:hypothetical protein
MLENKFLFLPQFKIKRKKNPFIVFPVKDSQDAGMNIGRWAGMKLYNQLIKEGVIK